MLFRSEAHWKGGSACQVAASGGTYDFTVTDNANRGVWTDRNEGSAVYQPDSFFRTFFRVWSKYPQTFYLLLEGGIELHEIIIGGMGARENRKVLYKNICASDEELEVLKKLYHSGISVKIQIVPEEKGIPLDTLL